MGNAPSTTPLSEYCKDQAIVAKQCMAKYKFEPEAFRPACGQELEQYKKCKQEWHRITEKLLAKQEE